MLRLLAHLGKGMPISQCPVASLPSQSKAPNICEIQVSLDALLVSKKSEKEKKSYIDWRVMKKYLAGEVFLFEKC